MSKHLPAAQKLPELVACDSPFCEDGEVNGAFYASRCYKCNGFGYLDKATGEALEADLAIYLLKQSNRELRRRNTELRRKIREIEPEHYAGMSKRCGGNYRMD